MTANVDDNPFEFFEGLMFVVAIIFCAYILFNGVSYLSCLSSEGNPYWNKAVVACHFDNTYDSTSISQSIIIQDSLCFKNGVKINCSEIVP